MPKKKKTASPETGPVTQKEIMGSFTKENTTVGRLNNFLQLNDNNFKGEDDKPLWVWAGYNGVNDPRPLDPAASLEITEKIIKYYDEFNKTIKGSVKLSGNIRSKLSRYNPGFYATEDVIEADAEYERRDDEDSRAAAGPAANLRARFRNSDGTLPVAPPPDAQKKHTVSEVVEPVISSGLSIDADSQVVAELQGRLENITEMIRKLDSGEELDDEDVIELAVLKLDNNLAALRVERDSLAEELRRRQKQLEMRKYNVLKEKYGFIKHLDEVPDVLGPGEYKAYVRELKYARVPFEGLVKLLYISRAPDEYRPIVDALPPTTDYLAILDAPEPNGPEGPAEEGPNAPNAPVDVFGDMPALEDDEEPAEGPAEGGPNGPEGPAEGPPEGPTEGGPNGPEGVPGVPGVTTTEESAAAGVTVPLANKPKYHLRAIDEFFGSKVRPEWDTDLLNRIKAETYTKDEIIKNCDTIIKTYGDKFLIYERKSDGDKEEYNELRQLQFCLERGLQKGSRSRQALVKLSDLTGLVKTANGAGPVAPSQVAAQLSNTTNSPSNVPNKPNVVFVKEPVKPSEAGLYMDPKYKRPETFVEVYF